jgi:phosphatidate phosphatase APP1
MSDRPFIAARLETTFDKRAEGLFRRWFGWRDSIVGYTGYGSTARLRVLGRVMLAPAGRTTPKTRRAESWRERRGWRNFWAVSCVNRPARVYVGDRVVAVTTDRGGYIDVVVEDHGLPPGWHHVRLDTADGRPATARVLIVGDDTAYGLISDIDDTVIRSYLPRPLVAAWNYLVMTESARLPVPGMARLYREILGRHPGTPVFYVSTGTWNMVPFLDRFTLHHGFPQGPLLLSDWGPTNTGWFRVGTAHKRRVLEDLAAAFPGLKWILVGDDGQHDPSIYAAFAAAHPDRVVAIGIRELDPVQQVLAHGTFHERPGERPTPAVIEVRAPDGWGLWEKLAEAVPEL